MPLRFPKNFSLWFSLSLFSFALLLFAMNRGILQVMMHIGFNATHVVFILSCISMVAAFFAFRNSRKRGDTSWRKPVSALLSFGSLAMIGYLGYANFTAYRMEDLTFVNEGATLAATLYKPTGNGPFPAIVMVHGSAKFGRTFYHPYADRLVRQGYAVLLYDKRGSGQSTGEWETRNNSSTKYLTLLASDVKAAVNTLNTRPEIQHNNIGLWGISQGGWVSAIVTADSTVPVAFSVQMSGPAVTVGEEQFYSNIIGEDNDHLGSKEPPIPWDTIDAKMATCEHRGFNPVPYLEHSHVPTLWMYGEWDNSIPVRQSVERLKPLITSEHKPFDLFIAPHANHGLMVMRGQTKSFIPDYQPDVWPTAITWLNRTTTKQHIVGDLSYHQPNQSVF